jgi:rhodanese-related sulfurtransferase
MNARIVVGVAVATLVGCGSVVSLANCGTCETAQEKGCKSAAKAPACAGGACDIAKKGDVKDCPVVTKEAVVNTEGLAVLLKAKVSVKLLDARSGKYDDGQRIPGATQLSPDAAAEVVDKTLPDKSALIVTYCGGVKCPASKALADRLKKDGYSNVLEYPEGIAGWLQAGNAVDNPKK